MKLGTIVYKSKIYNLDYMSSEELKNLFRQIDTENKNAIKNVYNESENRVKTSAMVSRAYTEKISKETIEEKVNAQLNAIKIGIQEINPKFKEGHKNYEATNVAIIKSMDNYELTLKELSDFYDEKIEQLILRKVELEASLVGMIINREYLFEKEKRKRIAGCPGSSNLADRTSW